MYPRIPSYTLVYLYPRIRCVQKELFCHLTCSPDGSTFINVTQVIMEPSNTTYDYVIDGVDVYIDPYFGERFYNSCADVTFSQSNAPAMLFIGGGAENYLEFLNFLGKKQPLGSPFNLLFPGADDFVPEFTPWNGTVANCFDTDANRCTCVDCPTICPALLDAEPAAEVCYVGAMRCLSFALLVTFATIVIVLSIALLYIYRKTGTYVVLSESVGAINDTAEVPKNWFIYTWLQRCVASSEPGAGAGGAGAGLGGAGGGGGGGEANGRERRQHRAGSGGR